MVLRGRRATPFDGMRVSCGHVCGLHRGVGLRPCLSNGEERQNCIACELDLKSTALPHICGQAGIVV
eukprot:5509198-Alexandrium_andersonii.AAC.1